VRVQESTLWAVGTVAGLAVLGASAGAAVVLTDGLTPAAFAALLFADVFLASGFAMQLYRRGHDDSTLVGGLAGFLGTFAFFAAPVAVDLARGLAFAQADLALLLVVPALVSGALAAGGTLFLASGVRRYRARHGPRHAPAGLEKP
jgi:hypothetical protein